MNIPYFIPFNFSSIAAGTLNSLVRQIPYNVAVYGITIQGKDFPDSSYYEYNIEFINYNTGDGIFDEPIQAFNLQTDARTYFKLPSPWYVGKNDKIICNLNTFAGSTTENYFVTLLGYVIDTNPSPDKSPFIYSFPMNLGFQDNANASGQTSVNFNQQVCNSLSKHMLEDFELCAFTFDPWGTTGFITGAAGTPYWSFQIKLADRNLYDRLIINGCSGGGSEFGQGNSIVVNGNRLFDDNILQYKLPKTEIIRKGELIRVEISPAPTYVASNLLHFTFNQLVCMALIGNHLHAT